jgi:hypothetical protein
MMAGGALPTAGSRLNGALGNNPLSGVSSIKMQQLTQLLDGFSSAEILLALMLMSASQRKKDDEDGGGSALALLAGMALAQQMGQGLSDLGGGLSDALSGAASAGANFNAVA